MSLDEIPVGLIRRMGELLHRGWTTGVGISANQVGATARLCIVMLRGAGLAGKEAHVLINPRIVAKSDETALLTEACLSLPDFQTTLRRHTQVTVEYYDEHFKLRTLTVDGFDAQLIQHECDHLDGKHIASDVPRQQRRAAERLTHKYLQSWRRSA